MPDPLRLDEVERDGATRFGRSVTRLILEYSDGTRSALALPPPREVAAAPLTERQQEIAEFLSGLPAGMDVPTKAIAEKVGASLNGPFRADVRVVADRLGFKLSHGSVQT